MGSGNSTLKQDNDSTEMQSGFKDILRILLSDKSLTATTNPRNTALANVKEPETRDPVIKSLFSNIKNKSYSIGLQQNTRELEIRQLIYRMGYEDGVAAYKRENEKQ